MSIEKMRNHYAMTSPASVYDEEALTALELAGRTAGKLNEVVDLVNQNEKTVVKMEAELPTMARDAAEKQVDDYIKDGTFDDAIDEYAGELTARMDNLLGNIPEGGTTMDAEIVDARLGGNGLPYASLGTANREQYAELNAAANDRVSARAVQYGYKHDFNRASMWRQGWIDPTTGADGNTGSDVGMYIRTAGFVPLTVDRVECIGGDKGARLSIYRYSWYNNNAFVDMVEGRHASYKFDHNTYKYRLAATGPVTELSNVYITTKTEINVDDSQSILLLGDPIYDVKPVVSPDALKLGYKFDGNYRNLWEQGYIFGETGQSGVSESGYDFWAFARSTFFTCADAERVGVSEGYKARLFKYGKLGEMPTTFEGYEDVVGVSKPLAEGYFYRVDVCPASRTLDTRAYVNNLWDKVHLLSVEDTSPADDSGNSEFIRNVYFAPVRCARYTTENKYGTASSDITASTVVSSYTAGIMFDSAHVTTETLATLESGKTITAIRHKPVPVDGSIVDPIPKIIIVGGQHGFEKGNVFGMTTLFADLISGTGEALDYLRSHVELVFIPVLNPDGFDAGTYVNANGVNLNRNYDYKWTAVEDTESDQYGGGAPFDQPETAALRDFIEKEKADGRLALVIDSHAKGHSIESQRDYNWIACPNETDAGYAKLRRVCQNHLAEQYNAVARKLSFKTVYGYFEGFLGGGNTIPSLDNWLVYNHKVVALTLEGFNSAAFIGNNDWETASTHNSEILGNFILHFCREYSREV